MADSMTTEIMGNPASGRAGGAAVSALGLGKSYRGTPALAGLDLSVQAGTVHSILGPNGAGKTTIIRILSTLLAPDSGRASVFGYDVVTQAAEVRRRVSLTGQFASLDEDLTGAENLVLLGRLQGLGRRPARARAAELLELFGLDGSASRPVSTYSGGMRRRLDLAASLVVTTDLLFLDEPTTGLDPASRRDLWRMIRTMVSEGRTVLLTTQYLEEADQLAGRITVIDRGRVMAEGSPAELKASSGAGTLTVRLADPADRPEAERIIRAVLGAPAGQPASRTLLSVSLPGSAVPGSAERSAADAVGRLAHAGIRLSEFSLGQPSLDEVFLRLTGRPPAPSTATTHEETSR